MLIAIKAAQIAKGGGLTHLNKLIEWFGRLAPKIDFVLLGKSGQERLITPPPENFKYQFYELPSLNLPAQVFWERHILPKILRELKADLLFEPGNRGTLKSPCPKVSLIHNIAPFDDAYLLQESRYQKMRLSLLREATMESMRASQGIIFISKFCRDIFSGLLNLSNVNSRVIYHGRPEGDDVKSDQKTLAEIGISGPYLLSVSDVWRYKKTHEMVRSYIHAANRSQYIPPLVIAGANYSPAYYDQVRHTIRQSRYQDRILFAGQVSAETVRALYGNCRAFLFPSATEACPNILIEALAFGCAIACSDRGVMPEIADDAAVYFNPENVEEFSSSIISVSQNDILNTSLRERAQRRAQAFSWEMTARDTLDFFYEVAGANKPIRPGHLEYAGRGC